MYLMYSKKHKAHREHAKINVREPKNSTSQKGIRGAMFWERIKRAAASGWNWITAESSMQVEPSRGGIERDSLKVKKKQIGKM